MPSCRGAQLKHTDNFTFYPGFSGRVGEKERKASGQPISAPRMEPFTSKIRSMSDYYADILLQCELENTALEIHAT
jgi:hypothetical protein